MIVDIHTHTFPDKIAPKAIEKLKRSSHTQPFGDGTAAGLQRARQRAGVDCCVVLPVATSPRQVLHINDRAIWANDVYTETGLLSFGAIHPDFSDWKQELARLERSGIRGIKIHPVFQGVNLNDLRYLRILDRAAELGLAVLTHTGYDIDFPEAVCCTPQMVLQVYQELGDTVMILAHMGGWRQWEEAEDLLVQTPYYLDTAYCTGSIVPLEGEEWTGGSRKTMPREQFLRFVKKFGADRILFGTDSPWRDQKKCRETMEKLPISQKEKNRILGENAKRLLRLQEPGSEKICG